MHPQKKKQGTTKDEDKAPQKMESRKMKPRSVFGSNAHAKVK